MKTVIKKFIRQLKLHMLLTLYFFSNKSILIYIAKSPIQFTESEKDMQTIQCMKNQSLLKITKKNYLYDFTIGEKFLTKNNKEFLKKAYQYGILKKILIRLESEPNQKLLMFVDELLKLFKNKLPIFWITPCVSNLLTFTNLPVQFKKELGSHLPMVPISEKLLYPENNEHLKTILTLIENSDPDKSTEKQFECLWQYYYSLLDQYRYLYELSLIHTAPQHIAILNSVIDKKLFIEIENSNFSEFGKSKNLASKIKQGACIALIVAFTGVTANSYYINHHIFEKIMNSKSKVNLNLSESNYYSLRVLFPDTLWMHFGLYQGKNFEHALRIWYEKIIESYYMPKFKNISIDHIQQCIDSNCGNTIDSYKMYMMLVKPSHFNANYFYNHLTNKDKRKFNIAELKSALRFMQEFGFKAINPDNILEKQMNTNLPSIYKTAEQLIVMEQSKFGTITPFSELQYLNNPEKLTIFSFYTNHGYSAYLAFKAQTLQDVSTLFWYYPYIDQKFQNNLSSALDKVYMNHYLENWNHLLESTRIGSVKNLYDEISTLSTVNKESFNSLLKTIAKYAIINEEDDNVSQTINSNFIVLTTLLNNAPFQTAINKSFSDLNKLLVKLNASEPQQLLQFMRAAENNGSITEINMLQQINQQLPKRLKPILENFIIATTQNLFNQLMPDLNTQWQHIVPNVNQILKSTYPFSINASEDSTPNQWQLIFGDQSQLMSFIRENISPFINLTSGSSYSLYGANLPISKEVINKLIIYQAINQDFLTKNELAIDLNLMPHYLSRSIPNVSLDLSGQHLGYQHGPLIKSRFQFPNTNTSSSITWSSFSGNDQVHQQSGLWSWLKLLLETKPSKINDSIWEINFKHANSSFIMYLENTKTITILLNGSLQQLILPRSLS